MIEVQCPFCSIDESRVAFSNESLIAIWDEFPVSRGHLLIIPRRHTPAWPNLSAVEKAAIVEAIDRGRATISERFSPDGFNVGFDEMRRLFATFFARYWTGVLLNTSANKVVAMRMPMSFTGWVGLAIVLSYSYQARQRLNTLSWDQLLSELTTNLTKP